MAKSTAVPCRSASPCANSRVSSRRCSAFNSCGSAISNSRATRASLRLSLCSAAFHKAERSKAHSASSPLRNDDLAMLDALPPGEIMREAVALVGQAFARTIGGRRHGAAPRRPADGFHAEVVDRQSKPPNRFTDSLAVYPRLSCEATRKCALKHPSLRSVTFQVFALWRPFG